MLTKYFFLRFLNPSHFPPTSGSIHINSPINGYLVPNVSAAHGFPNRDYNRSVSSDHKEGSFLLDYTTALTLTVAIGLSLLVLNVILFAALLYKRERSTIGVKMKYDSISAQPLCTVDSGLHSTPTTRGSITPPLKDLKSSCSTSDQQCTELRTFPTPPDIGDRNTEITSHSSNLMSPQSISQFIPPPPLLATTPPTPPVDSTLPEVVNADTCTTILSSPENLPHIPEEQKNQYSMESHNLPYSQSFTFVPEPCSTLRRSENQESFSQSCSKGSNCPVSSCSYPVAAYSSSEFCSSQYSGQCSSSTDSYSTSTKKFSGSPCLISGSGTNGNIRFFNQDGSPISHNNNSNSRSSRSATLPRHDNSRGKN